MCFIVCKQSVVEVSLQANVLGNKFVLSSTCSISAWQVHGIGKFASTLCLIDIFLVFPFSNKHLFFVRPCPYLRLEEGK